MRQWDAVTKTYTKTKLSQMEYYSYRIFKRAEEYSTILRAGKLFQEFLVDAWAATEQSKLAWLRFNQPTLRSDIYSCIADMTNADLNPVIESVTDRPGLVARVFELKRKALMKEIKEKKVFGTVVAHVYTIEFQKRGLPHMHALIFLKDSEKIRTTDMVDKFISAEFPNEINDPILFDTVSKCMVHGPCGERDPYAACMEKGKCTKGYLKKYTDTTTLDEGIRAVKYIRKYIYKGGDRATMVLGEHDEIQQYIDARYIGPHEAVWRLIEYHLHEEYPDVQRLAIHLQNRQRVVYNTRKSMTSVIRTSQEHMTNLMGYFEYSAKNPNAPAYTYQQFPQHFVWCKRVKQWKIRQKGFAIGRMYFVTPNAGELYYLRMLLTTVRGANSFEDLKTVSNGDVDEVHNTFQDACISLGILAHDGESEKYLQEAVVMQTGNQLRKLFCIILSQCNQSRPEVLWAKFGMNICDDLPQRLRTRFNIQNPTDELAMDYGLYLLDQLLQRSGKKLEKYESMPRPRHDWGQIVGNKYIWDHRQLQFALSDSVIQSDIEKLNVAQRSAYNAIVDSVNDRNGRMFFLNGSAGTGKTFLYNTIARRCRKDGKIVLTVASSGIASLLLDGGRTAHSTFKIPFEVQDDNSISISKDSDYAQLLKEVRLIIWDEVSMQHRFCVEAVDRLLRDIRSDDRHFGGVTVVLGGDFRQTLPVVSNASREQTVGASIRGSLLWDYITVLTLNQNMRLEQESENLEFADYLLEIGTNPKEVVNLPSTMGRCQNMHELISSVYPLLVIDEPMSPKYLTERIILSPLNEYVHKINMDALERLHGETYTYFAADKMIRDDHGRDSDFTTEFLNNLSPPGTPPFKLDLKVGCTIMLLRNLAPKEGLCNGTRLVVTRCGRHVIEAKIIMGEKAGEVVFIPRITFQPSASELNIQMERRQFPIRVAYAMTIDKSQGQSVKYVGIDLRTPVFSHGQLYVALSRCTAARRITLLFPNESNVSLDPVTKNVVYPEVLL
ncbi:uncharacterized protein LOC113359744 [Papaver somniferum]|uniref:uncharacterized protein LOC113359744 n=1 Tax=Papaver somniferum TaxID=3469 RepID=UPI000E6F6EBB|nr:uncharacterized protein LOC113359744 [Papaver somniferum]